ncbi:MAG: hypothetical protein DRR06_19470 [Gammaproteobacteria bacterium]|nr:MAG: hypothetical protein DRR06_19470 [Gammaproteobacteria bacterium]
MSEKLYGHYEGLMDYDTYPDHVMAMTAESLHGKSEIAAELAYRDQLITELECEVSALKDAKQGAYNNLVAIVNAGSTVRRLLLQAERVLRETDNYELYEKRVTLLEKDK